MKLLQRLLGGNKKDGQPEPEEITIKGISGPLQFNKAIYPGSKSDFRDGVRGKDQYDLSNAFQLGFVQKGDVLEVTSYGKTENLLYMGPGSFRPGEQYFLPEKPCADMPASVIVSNIEAWEKIGHITEGEWNAMVDEVKSQTQTESAK